MTSAALHICSASAQDDAIFPSLPAPADTLDAIYYDDTEISESEVVMLATLQGIINSSQPRIYLLRHKFGGRSEWADRLGIKTRLYRPEDLFGLVKKYCKEVKGIVIYSTEKSLHYRNLACTVAGLERAIAVTPVEKQRLEEAGIKMKILCDITRLPFTETTDIYTHLYDKYWKRCTRQTLLSLNPNVPADIRDLGTSMKAATIWLDPRDVKERPLLEKFLSDMTPGQSVLLGWWHEERAGIGIATSHGLSTIPSDFYNNATVYAGFPREIQPAPVPKRKPLENKVYVAMFLSDGDNIQYCQHKMCRLWDNPLRGTFPINWTVSPGLSELGPGLLNYYYGTASDKDCLVSGPSGMGYSLIYDELNNVWHASDRKTIEEYTRLTERYLRKSGLRIITVWDRMNMDQMGAYADNCRYLSGATLEDWKVAPPVKPARCNGRIAFIGNRPCYTEHVEDMYMEWEESIKSFDGKEPLFFTSQGVSWNMGPEQMAKLQVMFDSIERNRVEICRADHFFSLYNEANGLSFNILMLDNVNVHTDDGSDSETIADGSFGRKYSWKASAKGDRQITFDLGKEYFLDRYIISHPSAGGEDKSMNSHAFSMETSTDMKEWHEVEKTTTVKGDFSDSDFESHTARYVRLTVKGCIKDGYARIADIEIYGKIIN